MGDRHDLDYLFRVLNDFDIEQFCNFTETFCLYSFVLEKTRVIMFLVASEDFSEVFEVIGDEKSHHDHCQQMVIERKLILSAKLAL